MKEQEDAVGDGRSAAVLCVGACEYSKVIRSKVITAFIEMSLYFNQKLLRSETQNSSTTVNKSQI